MAGNMFKFLQKKIKNWAYKVIGVDEEIVNYQKKIYDEDEFLKKNDPSAYALQNDGEFEKARLNDAKFFQHCWQGAYNFATEPAEMQVKSGWDKAFRANDFGVYNQNMQSFVNGYTGMGGAKDMSSYDQRNNPSYEFQEIYTTLYQTSPISRRLIDLLTGSCLNDGYIYSCPDQKNEEAGIKDITKITRYLEDEQIDQVFYAATKQMFMHGGSAMWIKNGDSDQSTELFLKKGEKVDFFLVDKSLMFPAGFMDILNVGSSNFNKPTHWRLVFSQENMSTQAPIHHSRFIFFVPEELPFFARINQLWWGNSSLLCVKDFINIVERSFRSTGNQVSQASMAILKVALRNKAVNPRSFANQNSQFQKAITQNGSMNVFDLKDQIERLEVGNLKHQSEATKIIQSLICTAYGIPWTVFDSYPLVGAQASDADLLLWYKQVMINKKNYIYGPYRQLMKTLCMVLFGDENRIAFEFKDPNAPSEAQVADMGLKIAQRDAIVAKTYGLDILPYAVKSVARDKTYPDLTLEEAEKMKFVFEDAAGPSMEGKDVKDDLNKQKSPSDTVQSASPESITSDALKK